MEILIKILETYNIPHSIVEVQTTTSIIGEYNFIEDELMRSVQPKSVYIKHEHVKQFEATIKDNGMSTILRNYNMSWKIDESMRPIALKITKAIHAVHSIS